MFVWDFLSYCSSDNTDEEPIPYLTDTKWLSNDSYMSDLDDMCDFNYDTKQRYFTQHAFPLTHSQAKVKQMHCQACSSPANRSVVLHIYAMVVCRWHHTARSLADGVFYIQIHLKIQTHWQNPDPLVGTQSSTHCNM